MVMVLAACGRGGSAAEQDPGGGAAPMMSDVDKLCLEAVVRMDALLTASPHFNDNATAKDKADYVASCRNRGDAYARCVTAAKSVIDISICGGEGVVETTAFDLLRDFADNQLGGEQKWKEKVVRVGGVVERVRKGPHDLALVSLRGPSIASVEVELVAASSGDAAALAKGDVAVMRAQVVRMGADLELQEGVLEPGAKAPPTKCELAADRVLAMMGELSKGMSADQQSKLAKETTKIRVQFIEECLKKATPREIDCVIAAKTMDDMDKCK